MVALLLKQQIQKNLSTFCHLCLVQQVNSSLACHLHVKVSCFPILRRKKFFAPENGGGEVGEGWRPPWPPRLSQPPWVSLRHVIQLLLSSNLCIFWTLFRQIQVCLNFGLFRHVMFHAHAGIFRTLEYVIRHCFMQNKIFSSLEPKLSCLCNFGL